MPMGMGGGKDSSGPQGLGADAFGGGSERSNRISFYMDDNPFTFSNFPPSVNYNGRWGSGYASPNPGGVGWGFNPSFDPNVSIEGQNLDVTGLGYSVRGIDPRVGASLNLQGSQGRFDPSISVEANPTRNFNIGGTYGGPNNYGFGAKVRDLFGVEGLGIQAGYGKGGGMGMISYGGKL